MRRGVAGPVLAWLAAAMSYAPEFRFADAAGSSIAYEVYGLEAHFVRT